MVSKNEQARKSKEESLILLEQEELITKQLTMSKPLVTELMEYFYKKEKSNEQEGSLEELVDELQRALEECLIAEQKFQKAAYYDPNKFLPFERTQRSAYVEKTKINNI